jgi:hypothetical protein
MFTLQDVKQLAQHTSWRLELPSIKVTAQPARPSQRPAPGKR